ncbi:hypothetical protein [Filobacillus milosensis]|nr:hypothetical protein [Filobacillus milosensis]
MDTVYGIKIEEHEGLTYDIECFSSERMIEKFYEFIKATEQPRG